MSCFHLQDFQNPPETFHPVYAWVWNNTITEELIDRELDEMLDMGIRGIYVIPLPENFRPGKMYTPLRPGYLTEAFFARIQYAAQGALQRGMTFWIYDEGGWPSGSAGHRVVALAPELTRMQLRSDKMVLPRGIPYRPTENALAAFALRKQVKPGDSFEDDTEVTEYKAHTFAGSALAESMDRRATELFIHETHEKYAAALGGLIGRQVRFMFTDEPALGAFPWCRHFAERFYEKYGYHIENEFPALMEKDEEEKYPDVHAEHVRIDYYTLCGELFRENYLMPIRLWCRKHGMTATGHLSGEDKTGTGVSNGYGHVLAALRCMDMPGVDLIWRQLLAPDMKAQEGGSEIPFFPRIASSAARQIAARQTVSESFNIFGSGLTWEQIRYLANYQYVRGINTLNGMSVPSGRDKTMALTMRPCYTPEVPGMNHMRKLNETLARTQYLLQISESAGETALYVPDNDFLACGAAAKKAAEAFRQMGIMLEKQGIDFDYIDDEAIRNAELLDGALAIGSAVYRKVFVPDCRYMPDDVRRKINQMADFTPKPVLNTNASCIRACKRKLDDGSNLYFVVNEGGEKVRTRLLFDEAQDYYRLSPEDGVYLKCSASQDTVDLESGQACAYLFTAQTLPDTAAYLPVRTWPLTAFQAAPRRAYRIDDMGIRTDQLTDPMKNVILGAWTETLGLGVGFSGEVVYRTKVTVTDDICSGDRFCLDLGRVRYSARVFVNGDEAGIAAFSPHRVCFPANPNTHELQIDIEIANTPANEILHSDAVKRWPEDMMQWFYHNRSSLYEAETQDGGLYGPVKLTLERENKNSISGNPS